MTPMSQLFAAVHLLQAEQVSMLAPADALRRAEQLLQVSTQLELLRLQAIADVDLRSLYVIAGAPTTSAWLSALDADYDRREVALAKKLSGLRQVCAEVEGGRLPLSAGKALQTALSMLRSKVDRRDGLIDGAPGEAVVEAVILDGVREVIAECRGGFVVGSEELAALDDQLREIVLAPGSPEPVCGPLQIERLEAAFVLVAQSVEGHQLRSALGLLVGALLPLELEARAAKAYAERGVSLVRRADGWRLEGDLDLEAGELFFTFLDAEMRRDEMNVSDTAAAAEIRAEGLDPCDPDELPTASVLRSRRQRMHDALRNGVSRYLGAGLGGVADKVAVHVGVTVGVDRLAGVPGTLPARGSGGSVLPLTLVQRWLCDSAITRFVMSLGGLAIEASHTERTTKAHERRAKHIETAGQCQCRGCRGSRKIPGTVLIPHHVDAYASYGVTSHRETVLLCPASHHDLHEGGKTIQLKDGRWLNASGWVPRASANGPPGEIAA